MIELLAGLIIEAAEPPLLVPSAEPLPLSAAMVDCRAGPSERVFGTTNWHVFACSDGSLTVLARKNNPVYPAMIGVRLRGGRTEVSGPEYVLKQASAAAAELRGLPATAVAQLHAEATAAGKR